MTYTCVRCRKSYDTKVVKRYLAMRKKGPRVSVCERCIVKQKDSIKTAAKKQYPKIELGM